MGAYKGRIILGIIVAAFVAIGFGWQDWRLSRLVKAEPQPLTCAALGQNGYGDNAHVAVTNSFMSPGGYVYEERSSGSSQWARVWVPLIDIDSAYAERLRALPDGAPIPPPRTFSVILQSEHVSNESAMDALAEADVLSGIVINEIDSLDAETRRLLSSSYPGVDLDRCVIVDHNRSQPSAIRGMALMAFGVIVLSIMIIYWIRRRTGGGEPPITIRTSPEREDSRGMQGQGSASPRTPTHV